MFHEDIRVVSETTFFQGTTTACMLARRLQVYYGFYAPPLKLCDYVLFYYLCGVRPCHRKNVVCYPKELLTLFFLLSFFSINQLNIKQKQKDLDKKEFFFYSHFPIFSYKEPFSNFSLINVPMTNRSSILIIEVS